MFRRSLILSAATLATLALPVAPALAVSGSLNAAVSAPSILDAAVTGTASIPAALDASLSGSVSGPSTAGGSVTGSASVPSTAGGSVSGSASAPPADTLSGMTPDGSAPADGAGIDTLSDESAGGSATGTASPSGGSAGGTASAPSAGQGSAGASASVPPPVVTLNVGAPKPTGNGCVGQTASVTGAGVTSVAFYLDGQKVKTDSTSDASGAYTLKVSCQRVRSGASGTAVVNFDASGTSLQGTMPFTVG